MANDEEERDVGDEVYEEEGLEALEENDEITPEEEAFMEGYKHTLPVRSKKKKKAEISVQKKKQKKSKKKKVHKKKRIKKRAKKRRR